MGFANYSPNTNIMTGIPKQPQTARKILHIDELKDPAVAKYRRFLGSYNIETKDKEKYAEKREFRKLMARAISERRHSRDDFELLIKLLFHADCHEEGFSKKDLLRWYILGAMKRVHLCLHPLSEGVRSGFHYNYPEDKPGSCPPVRDYMTVFRQSPGERKELLTRAETEDDPSAWLFLYLDAAERQDAEEMNLYRSHFRNRIDRALYMLKLLPTPDYKHIRLIIRYEFVE